MVSFENARSARDVNGNAVVLAAGPSDPAQASAVLGGINVGVKK